jgi:O-antigen/teichoic acid export membrane protein
MKREFSINILFLVGINLLVKPFFIFGIDRTVQNKVGTETYGIYFALLSFTYLFQVIGDFGIQNFNNREISQHNQLINKYFPNILALKVLLGAVYFAAIFIVGYLAGYGAYFHFLCFLGINQFLSLMVLFLRSNVSGLGMYRLDSILSILDKLLMIGICSILLWAPFFSSHFRIEWFVWSQTASLLLTAIVALLVLRKYLTLPKWSFRAPVLIFILKKSFPFALVLFLMLTYTRLDAVMIEQLLPDGKFQAGVYGASYRLLDATNMIGYLFASLLLPMFARMLKNKEEVGSLVQHSFGLIWAGAVSLAVAVFFFKTEVMNLLYQHADDSWGRVLGWLIFSFVAVAGSYIYGTLLTANGSLILMNKIFIMAIALNILLNLALIPRYKAEGAAISTLATQWFVFLAQIILARHLELLKFNAKLILRAILFLGMSYSITYAFAKTEWTNWPLKFLISFLVSLMLGNALGLVNFKPLFEKFSFK